MDPLIVEVLIRAARVVAMVTGALVTIDSIGILVMRREQPPHHPAWSAAAWLIAGGSITLAAGYLLQSRVGYVAENDTTGAQVAILFHWIGLAMAFIIRAVSRAERPWLVLLSATGMAAGGIFLSLWTYG